MSQLSMMPIMPLRQSFLTPRMVQESLAEQAQTENQGDDKADTLQRAHAMNVARARGAQGQTSTSTNWGGQGASPLSQHVQEAKQKTVAPAPAAHDWGDHPQPQGSVTFKQGTGPNAMSDEKFLAGQQRNAQAFGGTKTEPLGDYTQGRGYTVQGNAPAQQTDPIVNLVNQYKGSLDDKALGRVKAFADTGATPVQVHEALQHEMQANKPQSNTGEREATTRQASMLEKQISHLEKEFGNPDVDKLKPGFEDAQKQLPTLKAQLDQINGHLTEGAWKPPTEGAGVPKAPTKNARLVDTSIRDQFLKAANGDKDKARQLAKDAGWSF